MRDLLESQRRTDGIFRIAGAVAIDESRLVLYAGGMRRVSLAHRLRLRGIHKVRIICLKKSRLKYAEKK